MFKAENGVNGIRLGHFGLMGTYLYAYTAIDAKVIQNACLAVAHPDAFHWACLLYTSKLDDLVESALRNAAIWDEVKDRLKRSALGLSGGQQQRLCIARALAVQPEVLLMDEPTSALDPISTSKIEDLAVELKKDYTIVMVTHNMQQAARISDKTAFFLLGEVIEYGATDQLFSMPRDKRTEDYITCLLYTSVHGFQEIDNRIPIPFQVQIFPFTGMQNTIAHCDQHIALPQV